MNVETFFQHYGLTQNPFLAEEARLDPVFDKLTQTGSRQQTHADRDANESSREDTPHGGLPSGRPDVGLDQLPGATSGGLASGGHPEYDKILGQVGNPSTAVVFGEKGSGKTAIRLLLDKAVQRHNAAQPDHRILLVAYDDLNLTFDNLLRANHQSSKRTLRHLRLADHQDAILSLAVTQLVNGLLDDGEPAADLPESAELKKTIKHMPRNQRLDLATLALLYDQPRSGDVEGRFELVRKKLRLPIRIPLWFWRNLGVLLVLMAAGFWLAEYFMDDATQPWWLWPAVGLAAAGAVMSLGWWLWHQVGLRWLSWRVCREMPAVLRTKTALAHMFEKLPGGVLKAQPLPLPGREGKPTSDHRYQLTRQLLDAMMPLGYRGMIVLVDRVDEPTLIAGDAQKMKDTIWPMFDNKFLKQQRVGLKLLLPLELRHLLYKESPEFFQEARLDKQHLVDRLTWTGTMLYDLCTRRMQTCLGGSELATSDSLELSDLFAEDVTQTMVIDALNEMHQPRDAFKFLYRMIQEHCTLMPEGQANFKIARLTLETARREQARRIQELRQGLSPA